MSLLEREASVFFTVLKNHAVVSIMSTAVKLFKKVKKKNTNQSKDTEICKHVCACLCMTRGDMLRDRVHVRGSYFSSGGSKGVIVKCLQGRVYIDQLPVFEAEVNGDKESMSQQQS